MITKSRFFMPLVTILFVTFFYTVSTRADDSDSRHREGLRQNEPNAFCLTKATVHVSPDKSVEGVSVLIEAGRITRVGSFDCPSGAKKIDYSGKHIYAGLIDMYLPFDKSYQPVEGAGYWNTRIRPQRTVGSDFQYSDVKVKDLRELGFTVALLSPTEGIVRGKSSAILLSDLKRNQAVVVPDFAQHLLLTASRGGGRGYPNSPMGAYALARQSFLDAQWYQKAWKAAKADPSLKRPETNESLAALGASLDGDLPIMVDTTNELFVLRADRFAREFGLPLMIKGNGNEYRRLSDIAELNRPMVLPVNFPKPPNVASPEAAMNVSLEALMHWDVAPENPARVAAAGIEFAITTSGLKNKSEFFEKLRTAVERGLGKEVALAAITTVPAKMLGIADQAGSIQRGYFANLMIADGDLFDEKTKVLETWVAGKRFQKKSDPIRNIEGSWNVNLGSLGEQTLVVKQKGSVSAEFKLEEKAADAEQADNKAEVDSEPKDGKSKVQKAKKTPEPKLDPAELKGTMLSGAFRSDRLGKKGASQITLVFDSEGSAMGQLVLPSGEVEEISATAVDTDEASGDQGTDQEPADNAKEKEDRNEAPEDEVVSKKATFKVNYPLGGYGVWGTPAQASLLIKNVTVWTCGPDGKMDQGAVLIEGGRVKQVFGAGDALPETENILDGSGMHMTPGIIDCHSHMATDSGVNESGQAVTAEVRIGDFVDCDDINIYRQLAGGVTTVNILHGSANPIGGQNQVVKLRWGANDEAMKFEGAPAGIKFALGENVKQSNRPTSNTRYPQTRMGVEQMFHDSFRAAIEYRQRHKDWEKDRRGLPPRVDLELECIAEIVEGDRWIHCHSYRQDEILALIRVLDTYGIQIGTFQHILEGYKVADEMAKHGAMASAFADWWAYKYEVIDAIPHGGALMHEAGVVVSFNSDDRELARHLNHEAAKAVRYGGVPEEEALKFVTLNPARQLRIDNRVGSIEEGKDADLVLWSGHPLSNMSRCEKTWVDGRLYFDRSEEAGKRQRVAEMRQSLIQKVLTGGEDMAEVGEGETDWAGLWPRHDEFCHKKHDHRDDE